MRKILISNLLLWLLTASGCTIYKPDIRQGNELEQDAIAKLQTGMSKRQVFFIMGSPVIRDPFHKNRWDYVHTLKKPYQPTVRKQLVLYFENDVLVRIDDSELAARELK
jgi:outer membrane protein assembly factor BamE